MSYLYLSMFTSPIFPSDYINVFLYYFYLDYINVYFFTSFIQMISIFFSTSYIQIILMLFYYFRSDYINIFLYFFHSNYTNVFLYFLHSDYINVFSSYYIQIILIISSLLSFRWWNRSYHEFDTRERECHQRKIEGINGKIQNWSRKHNRGELNSQGRKNMPVWEKYLARDRFERNYSWREFQNFHKSFVNTLGKHVN